MYEKFLLKKKLKSRTYSASCPDQLSGNEDSESNQILLKKMCAEMAYCVLFCRNKKNTHTTKTNFFNLIVFDRVV